MAIVSLVLELELLKNLRSSHCPTPTFLSYSYEALFNVREAVEKWIALDPSILSFPQVEGEMHEMVLHRHQMEIADELKKRDGQKVCDYDIGLLQ